MIILMIFLSEVLITKSLQKIQNDDIFSQWNDIYKSNMDNDLVIMGSSRAYVQYNPVVLDSVLSMKTYNLGNNGRLIDSQIIKYDFYRKYNKKPKYIIQHVDYVTIALSDQYQREQFFPYFFDKDIKKYAKERFTLPVTSYFLPFFRYTTSRESIFYALRISVYNEYKIKGFHSKNHPFDRKDLDNRRTIPVRHESEALKLFEVHLSKAKAEGIQVIFVFSPIYYEIVNMIENIDLMYEMFYGIADKYQIPVLDYTYDDMYNNTKYFYDPGHLNIYGANLFSYKLGKDLKRILSD